MEIVHSRHGNSVIKNGNSALRKWKISPMPWKVSFFTIFRGNSGNSMQLCAAVLKSKFCAKFRSCALIEGLNNSVPVASCPVYRTWAADSFFHMYQAMLWFKARFCQVKDIYGHQEIKPSYIVHCAADIIWHTHPGHREMMQETEKQEKPVPNDISKLEMNLHDSCEYLLKPYWGNCGLEASVRNSVLITQKCYILSQINM